MRTWLQRHYVNIEVSSVDQHVRRPDVAIAAGMLSFSVLHILIITFAIDDVAIHWPVAQLAIDTLVIGLVIFRRRRPIGFVIAGISILFLYLLVHALHGDQFTGESPEYDRFLTIGSSLALNYLVFSAFRWLPANKLWQVWLLAIPAFAYEYVYDFGSSPVVALANTGIVWVIVFSIALALRYRGRLQDQRVLEVRHAERQDLARELHDVVAHHVSAIAVQAQAAQAVASVDPGAALRALAAIEETASLTIREMRRMVGILRAENDRAPMIGTLSLEDLASAPGTPEVRLRGSEEISDDTPISVYAAIIRIAQESITNARRHGSSTVPIDVVVTRHDGRIGLTITNETDRTSASTGGFGIIGMTERATSLGGTLSTGLLSGNRWRVRAHIPLSAPQQH